MRIRLTSHTILFVERNGRTAISPLRGRDSEGDTWDGPCTASERSNHGRVSIASQSLDGAEDDFHQDGLRRTDSRSAGGPLEHVERSSAVVGRRGSEQLQTRMASSSKSAEGIDLADRSLLVSLWVYSSEALPGEVPPGAQCRGPFGASLRKKDKTC